MQRVIIDGGNVALHRRARLRNRGTGKFGEIEIWTYLRFRNGLLCEFSEYPDTAAIADIDG